MVSEEPRLVELAEGVDAWIGAGGDSNAGAIRTPEGTLVIDAQQSVPLARRFRAAAEERLGGAFRWLVLTHYHLDHTAGNAVFAGDMPVLAHEITLRKFREILGPKVTLGDEFIDFEKKIHFLFGPTISDLIPAGHPGWDWFRTRIAGPDYEKLIAAPPTHTFADRYTFHLPGRRVVLEYLGPAHCDGDIIVHLPDDGIVFVADLLFHGRFPWLGDGDISGWIHALDRVTALDVQTVVPGHGPLVTLKELRAFRDMLDALRGGVVGALEKGLSEDEAVAQVRLPDYENIPRYQDWMPWDVRNVYRKLSASSA